MRRGHYELGSDADPTHQLTTAFAEPTGTRLTEMSWLDDAKPGGTISLTNLGSGITINSGFSVQTNNGGVSLSAVDFSLSGKKATFYFTSDGRVDFRQLVRDLSSRFSVRVKMVQVGARDEAGLIGGIGICGRTLCCSTWLKDFRPISIQMAKRQNLSLNPSKISGQCGRLLCCLAYEDEGYKKGNPDNRSALPVMA